VGVVVVAMATEVVAAGEEEVVVICSMLCAKGGRMAVVLMGHPKMLLPLCHAWAFCSGMSVQKEDGPSQLGLGG
jgi:hypothetical protein